MTQPPQPPEPPGTQPWPAPWPQPRLPWIKQHAALAVIVAGGLGLIAGIGIGAAAHTTTVT